MEKLSASDLITKSVPGEEIIFVKQPSVFILLFKLISITIAIFFLVAIFYFADFRSVWIFVALIVVWALVSWVLYLWWKSSLFILTNRRVENKYGIIASREEQITLDDIQAVDIESNIWGAIFNYGTVMIKAAGADREVDFTNVSNAKEIATQIKDFSTKYIRRRTEKNQVQHN